jgi:hypothetical protein
MKGTVEPSYKDMLRTSNLIRLVEAFAGERSYKDKYRLFCLIRLNSENVFIVLSKSLVQTVLSYLV